MRVDLVARYASGQEICLNDELIEQGFAEKAEESFLSEVSLGFYLFNSYAIELVKLRQDNRLSYKRKVWRRKEIE